MPTDILKMGSGTPYRGVCDENLEIINLLVKVN